MKSNKVLNGNCMELLKDFEDNSIDLLITDPPFRIHADGGGGIIKSRDWLKNVHEEDLDEFNPVPFLDLIEKKLKKFNAYIFLSKDLLVDYIEWINKHDYNWDLIVLRKKNPIPTKWNKYLPDSELCLFIREEGAYFNNDAEFDSYRKVKNVSVTTNEYHPTEKPIQPIREMIEISSKENDLILDPFAGSGTTLLASKQLSRNWIGIEINKKFIDIINKRMESNAEPIDKFFS